MLGHLHGRATDRDLQSQREFCSANAWTCARRATDRDLESLRPFFVRMLGYVLRAGNRP